MDRIINNPGLNHLSEKIFKYLERDSLLQCRLVSKSWKNALDNPKFWLKKYLPKKLPKESFLLWQKSIQKTKNDPKFHRYVTLFFMKMFEVPKYFCISEWDMKSIGHRIPNNDISVKYCEDTLLRKVVLHIHASLINYEYELNYLSHTFGRKNQNAKNNFDPLKI